MSSKKQKRKDGSYGEVPFDAEEFVQGVEEAAADLKSPRQNRVEAAIVARMTVIESIVRDLHELPPVKLAEAARYVHGLDPKSKERRDAALAATGGSLTGEAGEEFERLVRAEVGRVDGEL